MIPSTLYEPGAGADLPRISLVTCSFRQARFLHATLRSVLAQHYPALEYMVVDGGSDDGSVNIIRQYEDELAWWVSEPDEGQSSALIKGFARASGEIFGWLCSDDLLLPGALAQVGRYFRDHPEVEVVYGDSIWIDEEGQPLRPKREMGFSRFVMLHDFNYLPQPSTFWRRSLYEKVGGLRPDLHLAMDSDLWERFSAHTVPVHLPCYLSCMRYYPQQKTRDERLEVLKRAEDAEIVERAAARARQSLLPMLAPPLLRAAAKGWRVLCRSAQGAYHSKVPARLLPWLARHATPALDYCSFSSNKGFMPAATTCPEATVEARPSRLRTRV